jgi:FMN phosphatase YigB (HAD superfamily)
MERRSSSTTTALEAGGLLEFIDVVLSVDDLKIYKPDPRVYTSTHATG